MANATKEIVSTLGSSLVIKRCKLLEHSRKYGRSGSLVREILHRLRRKNLIYVHEDLVINVPLLLLYYCLSYLACLELGEECNGKALIDVAEVLVYEGVTDKEVAKDIVSSVVNTYLGLYKGFINALEQYLRQLRKLLSILEREGALDDIHTLFQVYLGIIVSEALQLVRMEQHGELDINLAFNELLGTRLFLSSLTGYVRNTRTEVEELYETRRRLIREIEKLKRDEDRHTRRYASIFLDQVIAGSMNKVLTKFYVTLVFYKKV